MTAPDANTRGAVGLAALPEDVLLDVLSRLRIKDLFLLAVTSKWWLRLFTDDPGFLRTAQGQCARLLGFFFQQTSCVRCSCSKRMVNGHSMQHAFPPTFFPAPGGSPLLGPTDRALTSFVSNDDGAFNYAEPLASRNGIVLMRLVVPRAWSAASLSSNYSSVFFGLCNPVTAERHVVPPTVLLGMSPSYAIVTDGDHHHRLSSNSSSRRHVFSQLLVVTSVGRELHLHSYTAATRRWSRQLARVRMEKDLRAAWARTAVVQRGAAHWLYANHEPSSPPTDLCIVSVEVGTTSSPRVSLTELPAAVTVGQTPFLCVGRDGRLSIAGVRGMHVSLWTQQDDAGDLASPWARARMIRIPVEEVVSLHPYAMVLRREWFEFNGGAMFVLFHGGGAVFALDVDKKVVEKLMDCPPRMLGSRCEMIVPYEMDLSEFFAFQLGSLFARGNKPHI